jgi:hypothetical protein
MHWDAIAAIGQLLGSIAVFITLGYLALQVRYTKDELRRSIGQSRMEVSTQFAKSMADERTGAIFLKANAALGGVWDYPLELKRAGLTAEEAWHLEYWNWAWWGYRAHIIEHVENLPAGTRAEFDSSLRGLYGRSSGLVVFRLWYEATKTVLNPEAVRYVDNLLAQSD